MRVNKSIITLCFSLLLLGHVVAQDTVFFGLDEYLNLVQQYHPVVRQSDIILQKGITTVQQMRGAFDPKLYSNFDQKKFDGKDYYDIWESYIKVPTLLNIDLKAGYDMNTGTFLNPENTVPSNGLYYAGVSAPLGQGLIHNPRNISLRKGKLTSENMQNKANVVLNNLYLDANHAYWIWYESFKKEELVRNSLGLINKRFFGIKESVFNGDKAAIDSVESLIQVQRRLNKLNEAQLDLQNGLLLLQNFIWIDSFDVDGYTPLANGEQDILALNDYMEWAIANHPKLQKLRIQSRVLDLDRKLSSEQLKPIIDVNYNFLIPDQEYREGSLYSSNNYKLGAQFVFPVLIRKERAKLKLVKLKILDNDLEVSREARVITNKIQLSYNKVFTLWQMIVQQEDILINYKKMLDAEQVKFDNGESSVFLLNSRENKKLNGEIKLIELKAKYGRAVGELKWSTGLFYKEVQPNN